MSNLGAYCWLCSWSRGEGGTFLPLPFGLHTTVGVWGTTALAGPRGAMSVLMGSAGTPWRPCSEGEQSPGLEQFSSLCKPSSLSPDFQIKGPIKVSLCLTYLCSFPFVALCNPLTDHPLQDVLRAGDDALWSHLLQGVPGTLPGPQAQLPPLQTEPERGEGTSPTGWSPRESWEPAPAQLAACPGLGWEGALALAAPWHGGASSAHMGMTRQLIIKTKRFISTRCHSDLVRL